MTVQILEERDPKLLLLGRLVRERHEYIAESKEAEKSHGKLLKKLAARRGVESQRLVSTLLPIYGSEVISKVVHDSLREE